MRCRGDSSEREEMRLLRWPAGVHWTTFTPVGGPNVIGSTESVTGDVQTVESPNGLVAFSLEYPAMVGAKARAFRGLVTALHAGANAVRMTVRDPDAKLRHFDPSATAETVKFADGKVLIGSDGMSYGFRVGVPLAEMTQAAAIDAEEIRFDRTPYGTEDLVGLRFGFVGAFGVYEVKEWRATWADADIAVARIWPPLRRAITTASRMTLCPQVAVRLSGRDGGQWSRGPARVEAGSLSLIEVPDEIVRDYWEPWGAP